MSAPAIRRLSTRDPEFLATLDALLAFDNATDEAIEQTVAEILASVRTLGDAAVLDYTRRFDQLDAATMAQLELPKANSRRPSMACPPAQRRRSSRPPRASRATTRSRSSNRGSTPKPTARAWARR